MWKLWYVFISLFSFFLCLFEEMDDGQGEMRKSALQSREARASRVGGRHNRRSSRASFSRLSMDDDDDGCEKFEISRGKIKQRAARIDTMMMIMIMMMMMLTIFIFSLSSSLSRTHIRIQMHYTDDRTFIEYSRNKPEPGFVRLVRRDELLLHKNREDGGRSGAVCRSGGRQSGYTSEDL